VLDTDDAIERKVSCKGEGRGEGLGDLKNPTKKSPPKGLGCEEESYPLPNVECSREGRRKKGGGRSVMRSHSAWGMARGPTRIVKKWKSLSRRKRKYYKTKSSLHGTKNPDRGGVLFAEWLRVQGYS